MEEKIFKKLDDLNLRDTDLLLAKDIDLSIDYFTMKRIEKSIKKKTNYYINSTFTQKISYVLGGIVMKRKIALVLSIIALSGLGGGVYANAKTTPVAYVSVDINPSVELAVNTFDQVVSVQAYNEDGEKVLEGTNLVNSDVNNAVNTLISNAVNNGYIKEDGSSAIEIITATDKKNTADKLDESLKETINKILDDNNTTAEVETEKVALKRRDEARALGITPGKLSLIQKLQELDPTIKVEDYKTSSVKDIIKKAKELRKNDKRDETTNDNSTSINADTNIEQGTNTNSTEIEDNKQENYSSQSVDLKESNEIKPEKNSNRQEKKEDHSNNYNGKNDEVTSDEKESNKVNSHENKNSLKLDDSNSNNSSNKETGKSKNNDN